MLRSDTFEVLSSHLSTQLYVPASPNSWIDLVCKGLAATNEVIRIEDEPFVRLKTKTELRRFHQ